MAKRTPEQRERMRQAQIARYARENGEVTDPEVSLAEVEKQLAHLNDLVARLRAHFARIAR